MFYSLNVNSSRKERSRKKCSEGRAEAKPLSQHYHAEADAKRCDDKHLVIHIFNGLIQEGGKEKYSQHQPDDQINYHEKELACNFKAGDVLGYGYGGQYYHEKDAYNILHHQGTHDALHILGLDLHFVKDLDDYHGGTHGEHTSENY